jgi:hypothetical protein
LTTPKIFCTCTAGFKQIIINPSQADKANTSTFQLKTLAQNEDLANVKDNKVEKSDYLGILLWAFQYFQQNLE